jgi:hypothetical protein
MQKAYNGTEWEDYPSEKTPLDKVRLDKIHTGLDEVDNRVITMDATKATKVEISNLISEVAFDEDTGIITFTRKNGGTIKIDTKLEKLAVNFGYDPVTEQLIITLDDGTVQYVDMSALITQYEFLNSDTISLTVVDGKVKADILEGSIEEKHLRPDYLADVKVEVAKAQSSAESASSSANDADYDAKLAQSYAVGGSGIRDGEDTDNAKYYKDSTDSANSDAQKAATNAKTSETNAKSSETNAKTSETNAKESETNAKSSETNAASSASTATSKASAASTSASNASSSASNASTSASNAATSETNANYYYEQCKAISESFSGALRPMGTVTFANLPAVASATEGDMYNISDQFTTTSAFKEGSGYTMPAGTNVYKTADGYWDCLAGSPVTGVKGNSESSYRRGNVNITADDIGLGKVGNFKAVSTEENQGLDDTEKSNARTNIAAADSALYSDTTISVGRKEDTDVGNYSTAIGVNNISSNYCSFSEGFQNSTSGVYSYAVGYKNTVSGYCSGAVGYMNENVGEYSLANGLRCYASGKNQYVFGLYGNLNGRSNNKMIIVGGNTSSGLQDVFTMDYDGNVTCKNVTARTDRGQNLLNSLQKHAEAYDIGTTAQDFTLEAGHTYLLLVYARTASTDAVYGMTTRMIAVPDSSSSTANCTILSLGVTSNTGFTITAGNFKVSVKASSATYEVDAVLYDMSGD